MSGELLEELQKKNNVLVVVSEQGTVKIPAKGINTGKLTDTFGPSVDPKDVTVTVTLSTLTGEEAKKVTALVEKTGGQVMMPPVILGITASHDGKNADITESDTYMTMTVPIPDGVDPSKITTAVFTDENGSVHHVPTKVSIIDGKYCATVSTRYAGVPCTFVWNPVEFKDVTGHWAEAAINNMGSRMVVSGVGANAFEPDRSITRAEFATIIVKALGLMPGIGENTFSDVGASDWYCSFTEAAGLYNLISGYPDGTFGPNDPITREQAMVILYRAMALTGLNTSLTSTDVDALLDGFSDAEKSAVYAREGIAACIEAGIVMGKDNNKIAPQEDITRAEVAVIIERLLQKSSLI
jgi:hypothetical protein